MPRKLTTLWLLMAILFSLSCSLFRPAETPAPAIRVTTPPEPPRSTQPPAAELTLPPVAEPTRPAPAPLPTQEHRTTTVGQLEVDYVYTSNLITVIYPLYGSLLDDFAIVVVTNTGTTPAQILVRTEVSGYTTQSSDTLTVPGGEAWEIRQNPRLIPEVIEQLNVEKPAQFHIRVALLDEGEEKLLLDETGETLVYARRDFPWAIPGFNDEEVFELVAAMVTPNDPAVEELIRAAAEYTELGMMWSGYGGHVGDDNGAVWERLEAIWEAEARDYDLTYISTWVSYAPGDVQRIRLPAEVLEQRSGNCIELALLFAAAAEALDLETALIRIPGHAYMAVRIDQEGADYYFIETTMIGQASFEEAVAFGGQEFDEALPRMEAGDDYYDWITVWDAREKGILPLPWR